MGKSASGYALRGFPHANAKHHPANYCATLNVSRAYEIRLKSLGKIQRAPLGNIGRAATPGYHNSALMIVLRQLTRYLRKTELLGRSCIVALVDDYPSALVMKLCTLAEN